MKRIDVLKGIEQILVQKAYETGHISHRADGDWQKQADRSWTPYTGQSNQSTPQAQEPAPTENTEYGEITEEDLIETPKFDSDNEEKGFLKEEYGIDLDDYKDSDMQAIRHDLSTTYGMSGDRLDYVANLIMSNLPEDDEPSDDEIYDYEDDLMYEKEALNDYKKSHPYPVLSNDGHSKGLTSEKDMFEDAIDRFRTLTDPEEEERLTPSEALKQMKEEMEYGEGIDPESYTPAVKSGFKKFSDWISDFAGVEKSAVRDMRSIPTTKNMGF